jgi:hypothetical protein
MSGMKSITPLVSCSVPINPNQPAAKKFDYIHRKIPITKMDFQKPTAYPSPLEKDKG